MPMIFLRMLMLLCLSGLNTTVFAATSPLANDDWTITVTPYLWAQSSNGNVSALGHRAPLNVPFDKALRDTNAGFMGNVSVTHGRLGGFIDAQYLRLSGSHNIDAYGDQISGRGSSTMVSLGAFYRAYQFPLGGNTIFNDPRLFIVEPLVGVRWTRLSAHIGALGHEVSDHALWQIPFVGSRLIYDLSDRWRWGIEGDIGGLHDQLALQGQTWLGYRTVILGVNTELRAGYRALYQNYKKGDFDWDVTQYGPVVGVAMHF
ncbi:hypothetical protein ACTZGB_09750 [Yersinia bercovieri]|uniref:hypothetical protein n=1 Tax=Yersinia TaxID=629 RepID=UPI00110EBD36|nr:MULTISPECIES: hypothetical protein [Yersinia]QDW32219.1 hypothetical protein FFE93_003605 [Yersinia sp. KBS0713]